MKKIESFLKSNYYPLIIATLGFIGWALPTNFLWLNNVLILLVILFLVLILSFYKNTKYIIPILISIMFMINVQEIGAKDLEGVTIYHFILGLIIVGLIINFIRFKVKFRFDFIAFGLLLIALSYFIPLAYMPITNAVYSVSITGIVYVLVYVFFISTSKLTTDEILNYFFFASLQLLTIMVYKMGTGFLELIKQNNLEDTISKGLKNGWGGTDYGFGNINDLTIHLAILSSGIFYKVFKNPKKYFYWIFAVIGVTAIVFSGSRGGLITLFLTLLAYYIVLLARGSKEHIIAVHVLMFGALALMLANTKIISILYENFIQGGFGDLDVFSTGRITLYKEAIEVFKEYPVFGAGWTTLEANNVDRIQVFHSTVFHTLAIGGVFGAIAVTVYVVASYQAMFKNRKFNVLILGIPWTTTMIHGLFDNTVHMVIFTLLTILMFTGIKTENQAEVNSKDIMFKDLKIDQVIS